MGAKILWVLLPLVLYCLLLVLVWRGRGASRLAVNMHGSLLLIVYLLSTAGLGIFWVANQQLPVFDWHYLFGYVTLLLVALHLFFNLPALVRWLRARGLAGTQAPSRSEGSPPSSRAARQAAARSQPARWRPVAASVALAAALGGAYWLGTQSAGEPASGNSVAPDAGVQAVLRFHEYSSESRTSAFRRAPVPSLDAQPPAFKSYPDARHIALERGQAAADGRGLEAMLRGPATGSGMTGPLTLARLGQILYLSAGVTARRGGLALRAAPSSGALFPAELYVIARRVDGLAAGLYHYDAEHHQLDAIGSSGAARAPGAPGTLPASLAGLLGEAEALIVLAAVFDRTAWKYRNRAYRYVAADLGHMLENVRLAGHYAGRHVHLPVLFEEAPIAHALGLDGQKEGILAVAAIGGPPRAADVRPAADVLPVAAGSPRAAAMSSVTGAIHDATSITTAAGGDAPTDDELVRLPRIAAAPAAGGDLHATVVARRSKRRFDAAPVPLADLSTLLANMAQAPLLSNAIRVDLVVNRVAGLEPGVYSYQLNQQIQQNQHTLKLIRTGDLAQEAQSAALAQDVIGNAAVVLILSADRPSMFAQGARGYRMAFLEAGMMGQRWLLSATARNLAACPVGAFYDDEAAALIKADPRQRWVLHFAALGQPAN